jgi:histidyl-tRNA synthetase
MDIITAVRGFKDILPEESGTWSFIEAKAREIFTAFGFNEIRIPIVEKTDLFVRSIGETTDIVEKEMYTFVDRGEESLTLRPEATASVIRAYLEHNLYAADPITRLFAIGPMFRRERPQKGRYRQFNQINVESLGLDDPRVDAEIILMLKHFLESVGVKTVNLQINSIGCADCRPSFRGTLLDFLKDRRQELCADCQRRMATNPLRIFDCKNESCAAIISDAPRILDFICQTCAGHFESLKATLTDFGVSYNINPKMVRGLDYYTKTTFEVTTEFSGAQNSIAGGGRYDSLVKNLGGPDIPGIGFGIGFERLVSAIGAKKERSHLSIQIFIAALGEEAQKKAYYICNHLRLKGIRADMDYQAKSLKSQMKRADKLESRFTLIIGENELSTGMAQLRYMQNGTQESIRLDDVESTILRLIEER